MSKWPHLEEDRFGVREAIAAYYLKDVDTVLEIGGWKRSVAEYLDNKVIYAVDPGLSLPEKLRERVKERKVQISALEDFKYDKLGIVMLGLDVADKEMGAILKWIDKAVVVVVEASVDHNRNMRNFELIRSKEGWKQIMEISISFGEGTHLKRILDVLSRQTESL